MRDEVLAQVQAALLLDGEWMDRERIDQFETCLERMAASVCAGDEVEING
ncbi:MAG: hypothetical protein FJY95_06875 [Candidatus Handelsmanbacteria bacterium]|nr:hypothetical protein [Candidatus Handelsmanbacteria bacterium]